MSATEYATELPCTLTEYPDGMGYEHTSQETGRTTTFDILLTSSGTLFEVSDSWLSDVPLYEGADARKAMEEFWAAVRNPIKDGEGGES